MSCVPREAPVSCHMARAFSMRALLFEQGKSSAWGERSRASRASLRPSVVMARPLSSQGFTFPDRTAADRGASCEGDAVAGVLPVQEAGFHVEVKGPFAAAGLNTRHAFHLGWGFEILEVVTLVNVDVIDTQFVKDQAVVFFLCGQEVFEAFLALGFLLLNGFNDVAVCAGRVGCGAV